MYEWIVMKFYGGVLGFKIKKNKILVTILVFLDEYIRENTTIVVAWPDQMHVMIEELWSFMHTVKLLQPT